MSLTKCWHRALCLSLAALVVVPPTAPLMIGAYQGLLVGALVRSNNAGAAAGMAIYFPLLFLLYISRASRAMIPLEPMQKYFSEAVPSYDKIGF